MLGSVADRQLLQPRSLRDALRMLDQEGPLVPMAGCTDLYVSLNYGTLTATRFLNLWGLDELRSIVVHDGVLSIGALSTFPIAASSATSGKGRTSVSSPPETPSPWPRTPQDSTGSP